MTSDLPQYTLSNPNFQTLQLNIAVRMELTDGVTAHSFARINVRSRRGGQEASEEELMPELINISKFTTDIVGLIMIVIDEISQSTAEHVVIIHARLVQAWGLATANKIAFIFVGDFNQQLTFMGTNLASGSVKMVCSDRHIAYSDIKRNSYNEDSPVRAGIQLFLGNTRRFELKTQNCSQDIRHNEDLLDIYENGEVTSEHLSQLKFLNKTAY